MELRHLRYFCTVAEELNISRAAEKLGISQPPLSSQIRQLERELHVELFRRTSSGVSLTESGTALWASAVRVLQDVDGFERLARQLRAGSRGSLKIGAVGSALLGELPELIRAAGRAMPDVVMELENIENTGDQHQALANHRIDFGVAQLGAYDAGFESLELSRDRLVAVLEAGHPLAAREGIALRELHGSRFVLFPRGIGIGLWEEIVNACRIAGFTPEGIIEAASAQIIVGMVAAGRGVSVLPESVRAMTLPSVRYVRIDEPVTYSTLSLCWLPGNLSPTASRFVRFARQFVATREAWRHTRGV